MTKTHTLNQYKSECATLAKRKALTAKIEAIAAKYGAAVEIDDESYADYHGREVVVTLGPWSFRISLWGRSNVGAYVVSIYTDWQSDAKLPSGFASAIGGEVNPYHRQKATIVENSFDAMAVGLDYGLNCLSTALEV